MTEEKKSSWLSEFFDNQRVLIESAETPFAKLAVFILPILAPAVPAFLTGAHLYQLFLLIFTFRGADVLAFIMSTIIGVVLELLGYVGATEFIKSMFTWLKEKTQEHLVPMGTNFFAYLFYLVVMLMVNVLLGNYFNTAGIVVAIIGTLSFITVPTSLLAANHLYSISEAEKKSKEDKARVDLELLREEQERNFKLEKYKLKYGKVSGDGLEGSSADGKSLESSKKVPDWRKMRPTLSDADMRRLANLTPDQMRTYAADTNFTYKTISNWRLKAREELGIDPVSNG